MKFAISCLLVACPAFAYRSALFQDSGLALPGLGFPILATTPLTPRDTPELSFKVVDTHALICRSAQKHGVPAAFVKSIMAAESNFDCYAISPKGAIGLMQLMPETAREYGADPSIPEQNVDAGTRYLRVLIDKYRKYGNSMPRVIAAYNAGPTIVDRYHGVPPFRETRRYVLRVLGFLRRFQKEPA